jgi:hypothetical protein
VKPLRVIIAGGRDFNDYEKLKKVCDRMLCGREWVIISGTARGADQLGEKYAREHGFEIERHPADWDKHGKSAGYRRNRKMADRANAVVVFWNGGSRGTGHMIDIAKELGLPIHVESY